MKNEKKKFDKKALVVGSLAALLIMITVAVTYKTEFAKPEGAVYADSGYDIKPIVEVTPTPIEDKPIYVMDVEEILNTKPVVTTVIPVPEEVAVQADQITDVPEEVTDKDVAVEKQDNAADQDTNDGKAIEPVKKESKEEKKVVIDESPKTVKEKNVNEYKGGEKTGSGNTLQDAFPSFDFSAKEPEGEDVNGDVPASGVAVGTWN
jgi:hypothetical protein